MRRLSLTLLLLCALPALAQVMPARRIGLGFVSGSGGITYDAYGGVSNVSCTNPNGTTYFGLTTLASHKVLCTPAGHPYFGRGFFVMDDTSNGADESGMTYTQYVTTKFGSESSWADQELTRMKAWGFNMTGPYSATYVIPWQGASPAVPYVFNEEPCANSWTNRYSWSTAPTKDLMGASSPFWNITNNFSGVADYEDPVWTTYVNTEISSGGDYDVQQTIAASSTNKSYFLGIAGCDSDDTHGFEAGPDFATQPYSGYNDFRLSYLVALMSPVQWATARQSGELYTDSTVYSKKTLYTQLTGEYGSVAALNTAWGSSYTTFGTSGTCFGSGFGSWICPSPSAATSVGTGNGSTLTFSATLTTTVSANSLGIFVAGTLVGGDEGDGHFSTGGAIYGPNLSGTINYSTGALSLTFTSGHAPTSAAAITAEYIANGWGIGTGAMDEDGRSSHQGWTGTNAVCVDGVGDSSVCTGGYASAGMGVDLGTLDTTLAAKYASTFKSAITAALPGGLFLGPDTCGTWGVPPNRYVVAGMAPYTDVCMLNVVNTTQAMVDFMHAHGADMALGITNYNTANFDSIFAFPGSACTRSGTAVTCTVATPNQFATSILIQTSCTDSTYNVTQVYPTSYSAGSLHYTASSTPTNASTTCNVAQASDSADYATQALRGAAVATTLATLQNTKYTADGVYPFVLDLWWQWFDPQRENQNLGIVDTRDNAYNGVETTTASISCSAPLAAYPCGGELRGSWGSDSVIGPVATANAAIDAYLGGL